MKISQAVHTIEAKKNLVDEKRKELNEVKQRLLACLEDMDKIISVDKIKEEIDVIKSWVEKITKD